MASHHPREEPELQELPGSMQKWLRLHGGLAVGAALSEGFGLPLAEAIACAA